MDKSVLGYMRIGSFRIGVLNDSWDKLLTSFENVSTPHKLVSNENSNVVINDDSLLRIGMYTDDWNKLLKTFKESG